MQATHPNPALESKLPTLSDLRSTLNIALPLGVGYVGWILIGVTDTVMLGRLSPDALSAAGIALAVYNIIQIIGWGMLFPVMVLVSRICGAKQSRTRIVLMIIRQGLWICGILSVPGSVILWNITPILIRTGQDHALAHMAGQYMDYYAWNLFPAFATIMFSLAFAAMERTGVVALITWLQVGINIILNYGLIFGNLGFPAMGIAGAGLLSVIIYGLGHMAFFSILALHRFFKSPRLFRRAWRPNWNILGWFFRLGWPKSIEMFITYVPFSIFSLLAGRIGVQAVAAYTIAFTTATTVSYTLSWATADTVTVRVSGALTRKSYVDMWRSLTSGIAILFIFLAPLIAIFSIFPEWVVMLFIGSRASENPHLVSLASSLIMSIAIFVIVDGLRLVNNQALNGLSDMKNPMITAAATYWGIAIPLGASLGFSTDLGVEGFWIGIIFGTSVAVIFYMLRFGRLVRGFEAQ
uniref:Multidrug resistance protein, MATE family n=1 Tax=Candidatus Kentrum sp. MB TaxID=2138164 RepID=A0A450XYM0_9GAMM|nr:MAG: multidrug resistance protein, MATE family [Candidatus Kentron sp. MB]VFK76673.1 MAG: multidrug resistance protein, MATE family [Candidatus Kentron sp. MB]